MGDGERINKVSKTMKLTELQILKEEEKVLMGISSKLNDQLNRLKVEELALMSRIRNTSSSAPPTPRVEHGVAMTQQEEEEDAKYVNLQPLDLGAQLQQSLTAGLEYLVEEDEEEDAETVQHDELTHFMQQLERNNKQQNT